MRNIHCTWSTMLHADTSIKIWLETQISPCVRTQSVNHQFLLSTTHLPAAGIFYYICLHCYLSTQNTNSPPKFQIHFTDRKLKLPGMTDCGVCYQLLRHCVLLRGQSIKPITDISMDRLPHRLQTTLIRHCNNKLIMDII